MRIENMKVLENTLIAESIYRLVLEGSLVEDIKAPGQFVHLQVGDGSMLLRRPISISEYNKEMQQCTLIYRAGGKGTKELSHKKVGDTINVLGPLGNGFPLPDVAGSVLVVGGGIGVPPLYELSNQLVQKGNEVTHVLGFQSKSSVFLEEKFLENGRTYLATVDGSAGHKGFVTNVLDSLETKYDAIYACGPTPMLRALKERFPEESLWLSMEERMGCGVGACFACVVKQTSNDGSYYKVCCDGPVFAAKEVMI